ncbi:MAG: N-formylglutamate deformylase, partial [Woeseiaceae bacterium]
MNDVFSFHEGKSSLLVSIPHDGREIPDGIAARMTAEGLAIPDTDWHVGRLYEFVEALGAGVIAANYSRYVVDLNRSPQDEALYPGQISTGLCPLQTFAGHDLYKDGGGVDAREGQARVARYWEPYHARIAERLAEIKEEFGYALLWDAHSLRSSVPRLFTGELPDLNIGTNDGSSCPAIVQQGIAEAAAATPYTSVVNGRFKGGYITRHYGRPEDGVYAVQLELAGESCVTPKTLTLADLKSRFEHHTLQLQLECAGNGRSEFYPPTQGNQWTTGAVGCPEWTGVRLRDVLDDCGVRDDAVYVAYEAKDLHLSGDPSKQAISRGVPLAKALEPESLLAWAINGEPLPLLHGYP